MKPQSLLDTPSTRRVDRVATHGPMGDATNGAMHLRLRNGIVVRVIFSDGAGWDHVSVSLPSRCPTWDEMCEVKARFFDPEDCVVQYHPRESEYRNCHPFCLHLWRWQGGEFPRPSPLLVAP